MSRLLIVVVMMVGLAQAGTGQEVLPFPRPSSFNPQEIARNPFLPIGAADSRLQTKLVQVTAADSGGSESEDLRKLFSITTISIGSERIAVINRQPFAQGDSFDVQRAGNSVMPVKVVIISDGGAVLDCQGVKVEVPLQRKDPRQLAADEAAAAPEKKAVE